MSLKRRMQKVVGIFLYIPSIFCNLLLLVIAGASSVEQCCREQSVPDICVRTLCNPVILWRSWNCNRMTSNHNLFIGFNLKVSPIHRACHRVILPSMTFSTPLTTAHAIWAQLPNAWPWEGTITIVVRRRPRTWTRMPVLVRGCWHSF